MHRKLIPILAAGLLAAPALAAGNLTLDQLLARHYEALGGLKKIKSVDSAKVTGTMTMGPGMDAPFTFLWKRPDKLRMSFEVQGMTGIQATDGKVAWLVMPFMGQTEPQEMTAEQASALEDQADFDGPLVDWKQKGHTLELVGTQEVQGTEAYNLKITKKSGQVSNIFLDGQRFLQIREESTRELQGQEIEVEATVGDYKDVDGLMVAHLYTIMPKGAPAGQTLTFQTVELNVEIDDSEFSMPKKDPAGE